MQVELEDQMLETVASKAVKKDWEKLPLKLGFLESDIQNVKSQQNGDPHNTVSIYVMTFSYEI